MVLVKALNHLTSERQKDRQVTARAGKQLWTQNVDKYSWTLQNRRIDR